MYVQILGREHLDAKLWGHGDWNLGNLLDSEIEKRLVIGDIMDEEEVVVDDTSTGLLPRKALRKSSKKSTL